MENMITILDSYINKIKSFNNELDEVEKLLLDIKDRYTIDIIPCCGDYENCNKMCIPRTDYYKEKYENLLQYIKLLHKFVMNNIKY